MMEADSLDAVRRARKRATDRKSQRSHRERQRAYVRSLEQTIQSLSDSANGDQRVAALLSEQGELRRRCTALTAQLAKIRTLASENDAPSSLPDSDPFDGVEIGDIFEFPIVSAQPSPSKSDHLPQSPFAAADSTIAFCHPPEPDDEDTATWRLFAEPIPAMNLEPQTPLMTSTSPDVLVARNCFSTFPRYTAPQGFADRQIQSMMEEAIAEHQMKRFDTSKPSLARLLSNHPVDILAFRLFQFIKGHGPMPMHCMLATFWVQYLYLRWNVLGTAESYDMLPHFLRPAPIECTVPHGIFTNMLVWPEIRQALICEPNGVTAEELGTSLLHNLSPNWPQNFGMKGNMIASMDVYQMIEIQAARYDFWKVEPPFFQLYPQFKIYNLGQEL